MVWIKSLIGGATWEVTDENAAELLKWYPNEYQVGASPSVTPETEIKVETHPPVVAPVTASSAPKTKGKSKE